MRESTQLKVRIRKWAEDAGRWPEFIALREKWKACGKSPQEAWILAAQDMDPCLWGSDMSDLANDLPHVRSSVPAKKKEERKDDSAAVVSGASKSVFGGKKVATVKVVEWVASNMQVEDVSPADAPSSEAWGMLVWARRSPMNESQFWGTIYAKLLPSRSQMESEQRYADDGVRVEETAERLLRMKEGAELQREAL